MSVTLTPSFLAAALKAAARLVVSPMPLRPCGVNLIVVMNVAMFRCLQTVEKRPPRPNDQPGRRGASRKDSAARVPLLPQGPTQVLADVLVRLGRRPHLQRRLVLHL